MVNVITYGKAKISPRSRKEEATIFIKAAMSVCVCINCPRVSNEKLQMTTELAELVE